MGMEKYVASFIIILLALMSFSLFFNDAIVASGQTTNVQFGAFNRTQEYANQLNQSTQTFQAQIKSSAPNQSLTDTILTVISLAGQSVGLAVIGLFSMLQMAFSFAGDIGGFGFIPAFAIGLGITYVVFMFLFASLRAIRLGDTQ